MDKIPATPDDDVIQWDTGPPDDTWLEPFWAFIAWLAESPEPLPPAPPAAPEHALPPGLGARVCWWCGVREDASPEAQAAAICPHPHEWP